MTRLDAYIAILALPDESGMPRRANRRTYGPKPGVDPWQVKKALGIAFAEHQRQNWTDGDISRVVRVRRQPLRLMRKA